MCVIGLHIDCQGEIKFRFTYDVGNIVCVGVGVYVERRDVSSVESVIYMLVSGTGRSINKDLLLD